MFAEFCKEEGIDSSWDQERFDKEKRKKWYKRIDEYNDSVIGVKFSDYEKYGEYSNSYIRHALKAMKRFLKSLLTETIGVRDVEFNIKGSI